MAELLSFIYGGASSTWDYKVNSMWELVESCENVSYPRCGVKSALYKELTCNSFCKTQRKMQEFVKNGLGR